MNGEWRRWLLSAALAGALLSGTSWAQESPADTSVAGGDKPAADAKEEKEEEPPEVHNHTLERAGNPQIISCIAAPSDTGAYVGYWVGGGCPCQRLGDLPEPHEGTWGWDYSGRCFLRHVCLLWWHGRCCQGGTGAYKTDGPKLRHEK